MPRNLGPQAVREYLSDAEYLMYETFLLAEIRRSGWTEETRSLRLGLEKLAIERQINSSKIMLTNLLNEKNIRNKKTFVLEEELKEELKEELNPFLEI